MRRAFDVVVLKDYGNYRTLKKFLVISETMPQPSDLKLKEVDEIMDIKELRDVEVVIK